MTDVTQRRARRVRFRATCLAIILSSMVGITCSEQDSTLGGCICHHGPSLAVAGCQGCFAGLGAVARDTRHSLAVCGVCREGTECNELYRPPRCTPRTGGVGAACSSVRRAVGVHDFVCAPGLACLAPRTPGGPDVCTAAPGEGEPCAVFYSNDGPLWCGHGLTCMTDGRCRRPCGVCEGAAVCNLLETPPRCTAGTLGSRCGLWQVTVGERSNFGDVRCAAPLACLFWGGERRCAPVGTGAGCHWNACPAGLRCDRSERCVPE